MIYEYKCINCNQVFETEMNIDVVHLGMLTTCAHCQCTAAHERYHGSPTPSIFKGKGWSTKGAMK